MARRPIFQGTMTKKLQHGEIFPPHLNTDCMVSYQVTVVDSVKPRGTKEVMNPNVVSPELQVLCFSSTDKEITLLWIS